MTGYGISGGALSIVNAIASGFGAAFGISLSTKAEVREGDRVSLRINGTAAPAYFAEALLERFNSVSPQKLSGAAVSVESDIPQSAGLKSSSAAANAILSAFADEAGVTLSPDTILRAGALASLDAGVSVTGAFDDAAACLLGRAVFTDNRRMEILRRIPVSEDLTAVIALPADYTPSPSSAFPKEVLDAAESRRIFDEAMGKAMGGVMDEAPDGTPDEEDKGLSAVFSAMEQNGALVSRALGISDALFCAAKSAGAASAGLSGTGPALGILVETENLDDFLSRFRESGCRCIVSHIRNRRL